MLLCGERKRGTELRNKEEQDKDHNCNAEDIRNHKMNMNVSKTDWELVRGFYSPIMKGEIRQAIQWKLFFWRGSGPYLLHQASFGPVLRHREISAVKSRQDRALSGGNRGVSCG